MTKVSAECVVKGSQCFLFAPAYGGCFVLLSLFKGGTGENKFPTAGKIEQIWINSTTTRRQRSSFSI